MSLALLGRANASVMEHLLVGHRSVLPCLWYTRQSKSQEETLVDWRTPRPRHVHHGIHAGQEVSIE